MYVREKSDFPVGNEEHADSQRSSQSHVLDVSVRTHANRGVEKPKKSTSKNLFATPQENFSEGHIFSNFDMGDLNLPIFFVRMFS